MERITTTKTALEHFDKQPSCRVGSSDIRRSSNGLWRRLGDADGSISAMRVALYLQSKITATANKEKNARNTAQGSQHHFTQPTVLLFLNFFHNSIQAALRKTHVISIVRDRPRVHKAKFTRNIRTSFKRKTTIRKRKYFKSKQSRLKKVPCAARGAREII